MCGVGWTHGVVGPGGTGKGGGSGGGSRAHARVVRGPRDVMSMLPARVGHALWHPGGESWHGPARQIRAIGPGRARKRQQEASTESDGSPCDTPSRPQLPAGLASWRLVRKGRGRGLLPGPLAIVAFIVMRMRTAKVEKQRNKGSRAAPPLRLLGSEADVGASSVPGARPVPSLWAEAGRRYTASRRHTTMES